MLDEVGELAAQIPAMASQLGQYEEVLEEFMLGSMWQVDNYKQDLISYSSHFLKVPALSAFIVCSLPNHMR